MGPSKRSAWASRKRYFIVTRTLSYLYDVVMGRESADQLRRADPHRRDLGAGGERSASCRCSI